MLSRKDKRGSAWRRRGRNTPPVRRLGAILLPRAEDVSAAVRAVAGGPVDAVYDPAFIGAPALDAVRDGGTFVAGAGPLTPPPERGIRTTGVEVEPDGRQLGDLVALAERGGLTPRVAKLPRTVAVTVKVRTAPVTVTGMTGTLYLTTDIGAIAVKALEHRRSHRRPAVAVR